MCCMLTTDCSSFSHSRPVTRRTRPTTYLETAGQRLPPKRKAKLQSEGPNTLCPVSPAFALTIPINMWKSCGPTLVLLYVRKYRMPTCCLSRDAPGGRRDTGQGQKMLWNHRHPSHGSECPDEDQKMGARVQKSVQPRHVHSLTGRDVVPTPI